jgi:hypothetical protein
MANNALIGVVVAGGALVAYMVMSKDKKPAVVIPTLPDDPNDPAYVPPANGDDNGDDTTEDDDSDDGQYGDDTDYIVPTASYLRECEALWDSDGNRALNVWNYVGSGYKKEMEGDTYDLEGYAFKVYTDKAAYLPGETVRVLVKKQVYNTDGYDQWESHANSKGWGWGTSDPNQSVKQRMSIRNTTNETELNDTGWGTSDQTRSGSWGSSGLDSANLVGGKASEIKKDVSNSSWKKNKWGVNYFDVVLPSINAKAIGSYSIYFAMDFTGRDKYEKTFTNAFDVYPTDCATPPPADAAAEGVDKLTANWEPSMEILPLTARNSWQIGF